MKVVILWSIILVLAIICIVLKKKIRWFSTIILVLAITFFSLLTPDGKVLCKPLGFAITKGALESGIFKAGILILLQLFSKIIVSAKINLPGKIGKFINQVFAIYQSLTETPLNGKDKIQLKGKKLIDAIDKKLIAAWENSI